MQSISYYSFHDSFQKTLFACNRESGALPIIVNCAGATALKWQFKSINPTGRNDYYFLYLKKGALCMTINGESQTVSSGMLVIIPPHTPYSYHNFTEDELIYYWVHFTGSAIEDIFKSINLNQLPLVASMPQIASAVDYKMSKMFDIYIKRSPCRDYELSHCLDSIFVELAKKLSESTITHKKLSKSIKYINDNYTTDISVPYLAKMESLSVSRYITLFKETMHTSPYQYIIKLRLSAACEMLSNSDLSITAISEILGFQSIYFFSKLFKKHVGMSPVEYKKNNNMT